MKFIAYLILLCNILCQFKRICYWANTHSWVFEFYLYRMLDRDNYTLFSNYELMSVFDSSYDNCHQEGFKLMPLNFCLLKKWCLNELVKHCLCSRETWEVYSPLRVFILNPSEWLELFEELFDDKPVIDSIKNATLMVMVILIVTELITDYVLLTKSISFYNKSFLMCKLYYPLVVVH